MFDPLHKKNASFFSFSEDSDYLSYLDAKGQFDRNYDRIELNFDASIYRLIGHTQNNLAFLSAEASSGFEAIDIALKDVIGELSDLQEVKGSVAVKLEDIKRYAARANALLEWGFTETISQHSAISQNLNELIKSSKTPDQAWAFEQFDIARDLLFNQGLVEQALTYINYAIEGQGDRPGLNNEARFYMLRGTIFLGNLDLIDLRFVDLGKARSDFNLGAFYSQDSDKTLHAKALGLVGWTHYCCGEMEEAVHWLHSAVAIDNNQADLHFHYAKALIQKNCVEDSIKEFGVALRLDSGYGKRAAGDSDLMLHKKQVIIEIESYRRELISNLETDFKSIGLRSRLDNLRKTGKILCSDIELKAYSKLDVLNKNLPRLTVEALETLLNRLLPQLLYLAKDELTNKYSFLINKYKSLKSDRIQQIESFLNEKYAQKGFSTFWLYLIFLPIFSTIWFFFELSDAWWHYLILFSVSLRIVSWAAIYVMEFPEKQKEIKLSQKKSEKKRLLKPVYEAEDLADKLYKSEYEHLNGLLSIQQARA